GSERVTIVGNTLLHNDREDTGSGEFQIQYNATDNRFANNLVFAGPGGVLLAAYTGDTAEPALLDHNLYWTDAGSEATWIWRGAEYSSFAAYRAGSMQDAHSSFADPLLLDMIEPDPRVAIGSPAIDAGNDPGGGVVGTIDYGGNPRIRGAAIDIGAYEH